MHKLVSFAKNNNLNYICEEKFYHCLWFVLKCSTSCGMGKRTRVVTCITRGAPCEVSEKPEAYETCDLEPCPAKSTSVKAGSAKLQNSQWLFTEWSDRVRHWLLFLKRYLLCKKLSRDYCDSVVSLICIIYNWGINELSARRNAELESRLEELSAGRAPMKSIATSRPDQRPPEIARATRLAAANGSPGLGRRSGF